MSQGYKRSFDMPLPSIEDSEEIDIELTDWESESAYSETESDRAFIATSDEHIEATSHDSSYFPSETEDLSSQSSSDDENIMDLVSLLANGEFSAHLVKNCIELGEYGPLTILDERDVNVDKGTTTQYLISCWVDGEALSKVLDLLNVPRLDDY
jgi:hypothetical protein